MIDLAIILSKIFDGMCHQLLHRQSCRSRPSHGSWNSILVRRQLGRTPLAIRSRHVSHDHLLTNSSRISERLYASRPQRRPSPSRRLPVKAAVDRPTGGRRDLHRVVGCGRGSHPCSGRVACRSRVRVLRGTMVRRSVAAPLHIVRTTTSVFLAARRTGRDVCRYMLRHLGQKGSGRADSDDCRRTVAVIVGISDSRSVKEC